MATSHFGFTPELADTLTETVVRVASQVWARLELVRKVWDFRILALGMGDAGGVAFGGELDDEDKAMLDDFMNEDGCCLGPWFTEILQGSFSREYMEGRRRGFAKWGTGHETWDIGH
eukprot:8884683-Pyramimonas_sp.AAC.1